MKQVRTKIKAIDSYEYYKNIRKYHNGNIPEEKNNKGNVFCPLCKVRVGNLYKHQFSALHKHNVLKDSVPLSKPTLNEFKAYFYMCPEVRQLAIMQDKKEVDPFWTTAKQYLSINEYSELRRKIYEYQKPRRKSRIKPRRKPGTKPRNRKSRNKRNRNS